MDKLEFNEDELETIYNLVMYFITSVNEGQNSKGLSYGNALRIQWKFIKDDRYDNI